MSAEGKTSREGKCWAAYQRFVEKFIFAKPDDATAHRTAALKQQMCGLSHIVGSASR
jgi:hypothetical protein